MPTTTILAHKLKNPDFTATATDSAAWMTLAEIQRIEGSTSTGQPTFSYDIIFPGKLTDNSVTLNNLVPKYAASQVFINNIPTSNSLDATHYLTIPENAITTGVIASNAVTAGTIATAAVTARAIAAGAIIENNIEEEQIFDYHIAPIGAKSNYEGVNGQKIKDSSVTLNKIDTKLKGVLIDSMNPDNKILNTFIGTKSILPNDISNFQTSAVKNNITYTLNVYFSDPNLISFKTNNKNEITVGNYQLLASPLCFELSNSESSDISQTILSGNENIVWNTIFTAAEWNENLMRFEQYNFRILSQNYFLAVASHYCTSFIDFVNNTNDDITITNFLMSLTSSTTPSITPSDIFSWNWIQDTMAQGAIDNNYLLYSSREEFENTMFLSQDDYDKLGIWIKI